MRNLCAMVTRMTLYRQIAFSRRPLKLSLSPFCNLLLPHAKAIYRIEWSRMLAYSLHLMAPSQVGLWYGLIVELYSYSRERQQRVMSR